MSEEQEQSPNPEQPEAVEPTETPETREQETIRDPEAFVKANVEKYQRLLRREEERVKELEKLNSDLEAFVKTGFKTELDKITADLEAAKKEAEQSRVDSLITGLLAKAGLDVEEDKAFITGTDEDTIRAQVEKLAGRLGKAAPTNDSAKTKRGSVGNPAAVTSLTPETLAKMSPKEIQERWEEVSALLPKLKG